MKSFVTINFYNSEEVNLWKDNGGIPFSLSKYLGYKSTYVYTGNKNEIINELYQKYADIEYIQRSRNKYITYFNILKYVWQHANDIDILNFYFVRSIGILVSYVAKIKNPQIIVYSKLDLDRPHFLEQTANKTLKRRFKNFIIAYLSRNIDLYTVETEAYVAPLNQLKRFKGKIKYLPNGYFSDLVEIDSNIEKEKIILTVGRLGTYQKNTEMLISAIEDIAPEKLHGWNIYLVGSTTDEFIEWLNKIIVNKPYLKDILVLTGNIGDKKELYTLYARSSVFVLPSRWEGFPLVLPEALYFGCYTLVTNCFDGVIDIVKDEYGKIIPNENKRILQNAIEEILENKIKYINKAQEISCFAQQKFDWKIIARKLDRYFKEIYENRLCNKEY